VNRLLQVQTFIGKYPRNNRLFFSGHLVFFRLIAFNFMPNEAVGKVKMRQKSGDFERI
jgi:hypothetical protein